MNDQLSLLEQQTTFTPATEWNSDDWETPDNVAQYMASLVSPDEYVLEPFSGTGQLAKYLLRNHLVCCEINPDRYIKLDWLHTINNRIYCADFLDGASPFWQDSRDEGEFDVVCTNPPFSCIIEAIQYGLEALSSDHKDARLLYLLPHDWDQAKGRNEALAQLDCHIHHVHKIVGRVAYLKDGVAHKDRQINDAIFDIRPDRDGGCVSYFQV